MSYWTGEAYSVTPSSALLTGRSGHQTVVHNAQELMHQSMIYTNNKEFVRFMVLSEYTAPPCNIPNVTTHCIHTL